MSRMSAGMIESHPHAHSSAAEPRTILVIDDDPLTLESVCSLLRETGHRVLAARDGKYALALIAATQVDLVLTDVFMPGMDGLEVLRALRRVAPEMPVVVMSGGDRPSRFDPRSAASLMGAVEWIGKPFGLTEILETVQRILGAGPGPLPGR